MRRRDSEGPFSRSEGEKEARLQRLRARLGVANPQPARQPLPRPSSALRAWQWIVVAVMLLALLV